MVSKKYFPGISRNILELLFRRTTAFITFRILRRLEPGLSVEFILEIKIMSKYYSVDKMNNRNSIQFNTSEKLLTWGMILIKLYATLSWYIGKVWRMHSEFLLNEVFDSGFIEFLRNGLLFPRVICESNASECMLTSKVTFAYFLLQRVILEGWMLKRRLWNETIFHT